MTATPPGWYPDPGGPPGSRVRWWDGNAWTTHVNANVAPPAPQAVIDLQAEQGDAERARKALVFGAALYAIQFVLVVVVYHALIHNFFHQVSQAQNGTTTTTTTTLSPAYAIGSLTLNLISLGLLAVGILFLVWIHRAATLARRAGLPARHSPGMAVGGFLIPIVNFWFPYQATVDLLPPAHQDRSMVLRWWLLWLATQFSATVIGIAAFFSVALGLVLALGGIVLAVNAAIAARQVITVVEQAHGELVAGAVTPRA
jgi:hypothetical protein